MPLEKKGVFVGYEVAYAPLLSLRRHLQIEDQTDGNRKGPSLGCGQGAQELPNSVFEWCCWRGVPYESVPCRVTEQHLVTNILFGLCK